MANELAVTHGARAAEAALAHVDLDPADVDTLLFVSTTVLRSPNLDVSLAAELGMRRTVRRIPIFGLASLGGATALGLAADLVDGGDTTVLIVAAEMNSLSFVPGDASMESLVTLALFSDGAAAAVVRANRRSVDSIEIVGHRSTLVPDSVEVMGFDVTDQGLRWRLAPDVPDVARAWARETVDEALVDLRWKPEDLDHLLVHPGGTKVLDAVEEALGLTSGRLDWSRQVMRDHGNVSSATVLLVLERFLDSGPPEGRGLLTAMGPGFAFEHVVFTVGDGLADAGELPVA
jgi:alkylresorcinol/alkylpyrone synthase